MARTDNLTNFLTDVADSIRDKKGTIGEIQASQFDTEIASIESAVTPTKGFVIDEWDEDGYAKEITVVGFTELPIAAFANLDSTSSGYYTHNLLNGKVKKINLPLNMTLIYSCAFYANRYLEEINIDELNISTIAESTFYLCDKLTTINLPNTVTTIGRQAFYSAGLEQISLSNSLISIGEYAFGSCRNLKTISLPSSLTTIGDDAFRSCEELESVTINGSITSMGDYVFGGCSSLKNIDLSMYSGTIPQNCFNSCTSLVYLKALPYITGVYGSSSSRGAFYNCTSLKAIWLGANVTSDNMGRYAFNGCTSLTNLYINLPRTTVEGFTNYQYAFMNNTSKTGIIICNDDEDFLTKEEFDAIDWGIVE